MSKIVRKSVIASFFMLSMVGSLLIILSLSLSFGLNIHYKMQGSSFLAWTFDLTNLQRFSVYGFIFLLIFFLLIDSVFVVWFLCKMENYPLVLTNSYHGFNNDIECPLISLENTPQTPKVQIQNEIIQQKSSMRKKLFESFTAKSNQFEVMVEVHKQQEMPATPKSFIILPNNARQVGTPEMLQKILGREVGEIVKNEINEFESSSNEHHKIVKYVYIKPWNERADKNSLAEAIVYSGSKESLV